MPGILDFIADKLPFTPIGRGILAAREQQMMAQYRQQMMQRQQQEFDTQQQQMQAAQATFKPGAPHPEQIPVTPQVGSPGYDQARQQLDQTQTGTAGLVDQYKPAISQLMQGLAAAGQVGQAGQLAVANAPKEKFQNFTPQNDPLGMGGAGQTEPGTGQIHNYTRPTTPPGKETFRQMLPEELQQWGFPKGTVASLGSDGKPVVAYRPDLRESSDLAARTQQGGAFLLPDGDIVAGEFEPNKGYGYRKNGQWTPLPEGARPTTPSTGGLLTPKQFLDLREKYTQEQQALERLNTYGKSVGGMETGIRNWASSVTAKFRTMLGSKELNPAEFSRMTGEGQLQALLGLFRTDVVGPGVMTEFDARRVLDALGGNVGMLQNPQVVEKLLGDIYANKMERVKIYGSEIERNRPGFKTEAMPLTAPPEFTGTGAPPAPTGGQDLSPAEQSRLDELRRKYGGR